MTNLANVASYCRREAKRIYARVENLEETGRATDAYLDRLEDMAECLEDAASAIEEYFEIKRELNRKVLDVPATSRRSPSRRIAYAMYAAYAEGDEDEDEEEDVR